MIDKRINFRGGGMDMGNESNQAQSASMGNSSSNTSSNNNNNNNNNNGGGSDNRPTMADIAGPVTAPIIPGGPSFVTFDNPYMSQGLETNRYNNYLDAQNLKGYTPDSVNIPFMPLANKGLQMLQKFGNDKNTQFFADNVAGKYGYGYGVEDYQQYMSDRMSGKVGAYGNEEQGQNALSGQQSGIAALQGVSTIPQFLTGGEETDELISEDNDMYFNFGTYSNPIYKKDLV